MDTLKTLVVMGVMAAVGYGVYVSVWQKPEPSTLDNVPPYTTPPTVQIPGLGSSSSQTPGETPSGMTNNPSALFGNGSASGYSANPTADPAPGGSMVAATTAGLAPAANPSGATLIAPPAAASSANATQPGTLAAGPPSLLSSGTSNQVPAATYPSSSSAAASLPGATSLAGSLSDGNFQNKFLAFIDAVQKKLEEGRLAEAHSCLVLCTIVPICPRCRPHKSRSYSTDWPAR